MADRVRAQVLVFHEIVNDTVAGEPIAVTYCPLTGTVVGFTGTVDRPGLTFGTTGELVNSNLLMYDRETDSEWPQILVLSTKTGSLRDYGSDPYGSYRDSSGYYAGGGPIFPVDPDDDRFEPNHVLIGMRSGDERLAIPKDVVRRERSVAVKVGDTAVRAEWDEKLGTARVMRADGKEHADYMDAMWFAWYAFYPRTKVHA